MFLLNTYSKSRSSVDALIMQHYNEAIWNTEGREKKTQKIVKPKLVGRFLLWSLSAALPVIAELKSSIHREMVCQIHAHGHNAM